MNCRRDFSDKLVHFTKANDNYEKAYRRLTKIIQDRRIIGNSKMIRGGYRCVSFTQAPLISLRDVLVNPGNYSRYSPFGIVIEKRWIYAKGGRPVIYQTGDEFALLPEELRWRHVTYEPNRERPIDFTWEREWRIKCDYLDIDPSYSGIIVPDSRWLQRMIAEHEEEQHFLVLEYSSVLDEDLAQQCREEFPWRISPLR